MPIRLLTKFRLYHESDVQRKANELNGLFSCIEQSVNTVAVYANRELRMSKGLRPTPDMSEYTGHIQDIAINAANNTQERWLSMCATIQNSPLPTSGLFWSKTAGRAIPGTAANRLSLIHPDDVEHVGWYYLPVKGGQATWMAPI